MQIGFWLTTNRSFDPRQIEQTPFGGSEIEALHLARELQSRFDHSLFVFGNVERRMDSGQSIYFLRYDDLPEITGTKEGLEALIVVRAHNEILSPRYNRGIFSKGRPRRVVLWSGDSFDQSNNACLHDVWALKEIDRIILKSQWQKEVWLENFPALKVGQVEIIRKGLNIEGLPLDPGRTNEPKFIYASVAFRGLERFLQIWPLVKEKIPGAVLDCYCQTTLYDRNNDQRQYRALYKQIAALPEVRIMEPLPQKEFFERLPAYYAMLYPNSGFDETVCGVALEAMASGVPVITSARAGLIETIEAGDGILLYEAPRSEEYTRAFAAATVDLWSQRDNRNRRSEQGFRKIREKYSIREAGQSWQNLLDRII